MRVLSQSDLIVVKVGTKLLTDTTGDNDQFDENSYRSIGSEIRQLSESGYSVILVSSGAITAGILSEGKQRKYVTSLPEVQRYATRGWGIVVNKWQEAIGRDKISVSLLTKSDIRGKNTKEQLLNVIGCCMSYGDVFLVNENDSISDYEIRYGDNDTLASEVAVACMKSSMFKSVSLVLLTTSHGLNKIADDDRTLISEVSDINTVRQYAFGASNEHSRGGMTSKLSAAEFATDSGVPTYIANGRVDGVIKKVLNRQVGTYFCARHRL